MRKSVPFRNIYSNDTTNIATCISPYHPTRGVKFGSEHIRATVREVAGVVDAHFIQLAHGQVPWYNSRLYPMSEHLRWWKEYFEVSDEQIGSLTELYGYVRDGGDILADFIAACREFGQAPFVSIRLNDCHHIENCTSKGHCRGIHSISKFLVENRDLLLGEDLSVWSNRALNWADPRPAKRMLALITEQCEDYDIDGFELDFMRHNRFFLLGETTSDQRKRIMRDFLSSVRAVLDRTAKEGQYRYLSVRVPSVLSRWDELGLSPEVIKETGVDIVNLSSHFYADQSVNVAEFTSLLPDVAVYNEICHTTHRGENLKFAKSLYDNFTYRRTTPAEIYTTANLALDAGAAGVSYFNFPYYREHGTPPEMRGPFNEPPFFAIGKARDTEFLKNSPKHFFIANGWAYSSQLSSPIAKDSKESFTVRAYTSETDAPEYRLRATFKNMPSDIEVKIAINGKYATPCDDISEPYEEDNAYPPLHAKRDDTCAFTFPAALLKDGENTVTLEWHSDSYTEPLSVYYLDMFPNDK